MTDTQPTTPNIIVPNDEASRTAIRQALDEMSDSFIRTAAESSLRADISKTMKEKYKIPPSIFNKWARIHFNRNVDQVMAETDEVCSTYQLITKKDANHE